MVSPDKYIRIAYGQLLSGIGCPIYDMVVPKDKEILPLYVLITTQTKRPYETTKCGHEWDCTILLILSQHFKMDLPTGRSLMTWKPKYYPDTWTFDQTDIAIPPFRVYNTQVDDSHDDFLNTSSKTIVRKLLRFRHFISSVNFVVS